MWEIAVSFVEMMGVCRMRLMVLTHSSSLRHQFVTIGLKNGLELD